MKNAIVRAFIGLSALVVSALVVVAVLNVAITWSIPEARQLELARMELAYERDAARTAASAQVTRMFGAMGAVTLALVTAFTAVALGAVARWIWSRSAVVTLYQHHGLYPVVIDDGRALHLNEPGAQVARCLAFSPGASRARPVLPGVVDVDGGEVDAGPGETWHNVALQSLLMGRPTLSRLVLGVDGSGQAVTGDMSSLVHVAVGGSSGWGKSVFLRALTYQLEQAQESPSLVLIDLEGVTLSPFAQSERLLYPLADNEHDAAAVLDALARDELDRRKDLFRKYPGVDSLAVYNATTDGEPLRPVVAVIDEATSLLGDKSVEDALRILALRARKYGLWLLLAGQDWKASSLDTAIRNQLSTRVQFRALNAAQSRVLLGRAGAETLDAPGRALAVLPGRDVIEMQAPYIGRRAILDAVSAGPPASSMPVADDAGGDAQACKIRELAAQGVSRSEIERRIFGYNGGSAYSAVRSVLA
jgi:hypothetical protein